MARGDYNRTPIEINEKVIDLYLIEEFGSITISKKLGISKTTVLRILRENKIKRRDLSTASKIAISKGLIPNMKGYKHTEETKKIMSRKQLEAIINGKQSWNKGKTKKDDLRIKGGRISKGIFIGKDGYAHIYINNKVIPAHRYIWEKEFGKIPAGKILHHIDGNKLNNNLYNLKLLDRSEHTKLHWKQKQLRGEII